MSVGVIVRPLMNAMPIVSIQKEKAVSAFHRPDAVGVRILNERQVPSALTMAVREWYAQKFNPRRLSYNGVIGSNFVLP